VPIARVHPWTNIATALGRADLNFRDSRSPRDIHAIHPYPAKFTPALPGTLLDAIAPSGASVVDPFCGSGTTLVEGLRRGMSVAGFDINPVSLLISRAKTIQMDHDAANQLARTARLLRNTVRLDRRVPNIEVQGKKNGARRFWFPDHAWRELVQIRSIGNEHLEGPAHLLWQAALSAIVVRVSHQDEETRYSWVEKDLPQWQAFKVFQSKLAQICAASEAASAEYRRAGSGRVEIREIDYSVDDCDLGSTVYDCAVFSPPYPNTFDYHLYHRLRLLLLGFDPKALRRAEIGAHLKYEKDNSAYLQSLRRALMSLKRALKPGGVAAVVVGDSIIQGELYDNAQHIAEVGGDVGFLEIGRFVREIPAAKKSFSGSAERLRHETVLVLGKPGPKRQQKEPVSARKPTREMHNRSSTQLGLLGDLETKAAYTCGYELQETEKVLADEFIKTASADTRGRRLLPLGPFFHSVNLTANKSVEHSRTLQHYLDRTSNGWSKNTGYFGHSIHQYVGKFYPQIARQLLLLDLAQRKLDPANHVVVDPFCGSGTTIVESCIVGSAAIGIDVNPLAALVARSKLEMLTRGFRSVRKDAVSLLERLSAVRHIAPETVWNDAQRREYLESWFPTAQLGEIATAYSVVKSIRPDAFSSAAPFYILLSSILRDCSLQQPSDLRIRRRPASLVRTSPLSALRARLMGFVTDLAQWQGASQEFGLEIGEPAAQSTVFAGDSRAHLRELMPLLNGRSTTIVTSPPYAAALPYIDTDRLSIAALELDLEFGGRKTLEENLIGHREISVSTRNNAVKSIASGEHRRHGSGTLNILLERTVEDLRTAGDDVGFRKRNNPAVVLRYFEAMSDVLRSLTSIVEPGTTAYVLVGGNRINTGQRTLFLDTPRVISEMAEQLGWKSQHSLSKSLTSAADRSLAHRGSKAMDSESIVIMQRA